MATVNVVTPWPEGESLSETLHHELGHAWIAPLTAQLEQTEASVMLEEQLVETLGVYLASLGATARAAARRALASVVDKYAPAPARARISARVPLARDGGPMDPKMIMEALEALIGGDAEKCQEILKGLIASAAGGGAPPPETPPESTGEPPMAEQKPPPPAAGAPSPVGDPKPTEATRVAARIAQIDSEHTRARKAADAAVGITVRARIRELRIEGLALPTALETALSKMTDLDRFEERVSDLKAGASLRGGGYDVRGDLGTLRGRPASPATTPAPTDGLPPPATIEELRAEGAEEGFLQMYAMADETGKAGLVKGFRDPMAVQARARMAARGPAGRAHGRPS